MVWIPFAILAVGVVIGSLIFALWTRSKLAELSKELGRDLVLDNETLVFGPVSGLFRGSNKHTFELIANCVATLTSRRFIYGTITGLRDEIPLGDIVSVSEDKWFAGQYRNGRQHLIIELKRGRKIGFILNNHEQMLAALRDAINLQE